MYQTALIITLLCRAYAGNIFNENFALGNCLGTMAKHILKNEEFETSDEADYATESLLNSITTISDYVSYVDNLHLTVLEETADTDYNQVFDAYGYDRKFLMVQREMSRFDPETVLVKGWMTKRAKIGILQNQKDNVTFITNLNLKNVKLCTDPFFESYMNCDKNVTVTKHYLSRNNFKKICKVRVSWISACPFVNDVHGTVNPGLMVSFLKIYGEKRGVKVNFQKNNSEFNHELLNNGTFYKMRRDLYEGKHDVAIGLLFMNITAEVPFSYGPVFFKDAYFITMKKRDRITSYKKLTIVFNFDVWKGIFITFPIVTFSYFFLGMAIEAHRHSFEATTFDIYRMTLSCGVSSLPHSVSLRLLFVFYSLFSINLDSAYLGTLSSIFTNAPYDIMVTEVWFMLEKGVPFNINYLAERILKIRFVAERSFSVFSNLGHAFRIESDEDILKRLAYSQQNMTFTLLSTLRSHPYEASLVDFFDPSTMYLTLFVTFYIRNDFHLKDSLQYWSHEVFEKGFISKWLYDIVEQNRNGSHIEKEKKEAIALKVEHFEEIFKLLFFGYALALAALVLEFFYKWVDGRLDLTAKMIYLFSLLKPPVD